MKKLNQVGITHIFILVAALGFILFLAISNTFDFRDRLFSNLFPKPPSQAAAPNDWAQVQKDPQRTGYSSEQINPAYSLKWKWNTDQTNPVRFAHRTQPIVAYGKMFIGGFDGKMYAVDANATGGAVASTSWTFQAGGPILHAAAADDNKVIFGANDGKVYALNVTNGSKAWEYQAEAGFETAPLIVSGTVYIGSKDGNFYALNVTNGSLAWKYPVGFPIYNTAAYSTSINAIIFGAEDMHVYALNPNGTLKWKTANKLSGKSFRHYWPVVSDSKGVVILRTMPSYYFHEILFAGDALIDQANGGSCPHTTPDDPVKRTNEQTLFRNYFINNPHRKTFHVLNLSDGTEKFTAPILFTGGIGTTPAPPTIDIDGNAIVIWRSCYSTFDKPSYVRSFADLGKLDLTSGNITPYVSTNTGNLGFRMIGDEESVLSLGGINLYVSMSESVGTLNITNGMDYGVLNEGGESGSTFSYNNTIDLFATTIDPIYSSQANWGHIAPEWSPAVVSNGMIIWKADGSAIGAVKGP